MTILRSAHDLKHAPQPRALAAAPTAFTGSLSELYSTYIEPNLPSPESVSAFHLSLVTYCGSADPLFLLRTVSGTERRREYTTDDGTRFKATDNAPAWWTQFAAFQGHLLERDHLAAIIASIPAHMFDVLKSQSASASAAGWHIAHILPVKDGDITFRKWSRAEVTRRFIRNVHPCNYFLVPKTAWQRWGGDPRVIAFFAQLYARRYADIWTDFVRLGRGTDLIAAPEDAAAIRISLSSSQVRAHDVTDTTTGDRRQSVGECIITYASTRLTFKASIIERLAADTPFRVVTPEGTFEFTRASFYVAFPGVVNSESYRVKKTYNFPKMPVAAFPFRVS